MKQPEALPVIAARRSTRRQTVNYWISAANQGSCPLPWRVPSGNVISTVCWPECKQTHHLHIQHWADGGVTSVGNGASLCSAHHDLVHEGGYTLQCVKGIDYRFRVVDIQGQDIRNRSDADSQNPDIREGADWPTFDSDDYTRVECGEPVLDFCHSRFRDKSVSQFRHEPPFTSKALARYATSSG